jgi:hypothetical protein
MPVWFLLGDQPTARQLGIPTAEPVAAAPATRTIVVQ